MAWTDTSDTCIAVWESLIKLEQIDKNTTFDATGPILMKDLAFYSDVASNDVNTAKAEALAEVMDSGFTNAFNGTYQAGYNKAKATNAIAALLIQTAKNVEDLSDTVDSIYSIP